MKQLLDELRLSLCQFLFQVILKIVPKEHREGQMMVLSIGMLAKTLAHEHFQQADDLGWDLHSWEE